MSKKTLVVISSGGFGNQIFYLIFALYLSYRYGVVVKFYLSDSFHASGESYSILDIFNRLKPYIEVIDTEQILYLKNHLGTQFISNQQFSIAVLPGKLTHTMIFQVNPFESCRHMYATLPAAYKSCLIVDPEVISAATRKLASTAYIGINIRYGDKLCYALQDDSFFKSANHGMHHKYVLCSPKFYLDILKRLKNKYHLPAYIFSDSPEIVKQFILAKNKNMAKITSNTYLEDFYLLTHAEIMVASHSTFSFSASYLNKNDKVYLLKKPEHQWAHYRLPEDSAILPSWNQIDDSKYLLNANQELLRKMADYYGKCEYVKQWYLEQGDEYLHIKKLFSY